MVQLSMLPDLVKSITIIRPDTEDCNLNSYNESLMNKNMFSDVHLLLQLYMAIPVTSATTGISIRYGVLETIS